MQYFLRVLIAQPLGPGTTNFSEPRKAEVQLLRITLLRASVNKGKKKAGVLEYGSSASLAHPLARGSYFGLITPQVAGMVAS